jgi:hypothetical protein
MDTSHFGGRGGVIWGSAVGTMSNKKFLKSWGNLPIALNPSNFYFIFLVSTTQPSQNPKNRKRKLVFSPRPSPKKEKKGTCSHSQPSTNPKNGLVPNL